MADLQDGQHQISPNVEPILSTNLRIFCSVILFVFITHLLALSSWWKITVLILALLHDRCSKEIWTIMMSWRLHCHIRLLRGMFELILNDGRGSSLCAPNSTVADLVSCVKMLLLLFMLQIWWSFWLLCLGFTTVALKIWWLSLYSWLIKLCA